MIASAQRTREVVLDDDKYFIADLPAYAGERLAQLPWVLRVLLENVLRCCERGDGGRPILQWLDQGTSDAEIEFHPARILMHDTTCVPALVDIAALRSELAEAGCDPMTLNPLTPIDVSVDHSVAVDTFGVRDALERNMEREIARNAERYGLLKWASQALRGVRVHPPGTGIMHTLNMEQLARVVASVQRDGRRWAVPDTLIGTDSHTPMINGIGVLAWGVGGLEAEGVMFGVPLVLRVPNVVGVRLKGRLRDGVLATDLALTLTERLRRAHLADAFVEFFGPGVTTLSGGERAVLANMAPEYGSTTAYFPIDARTLEYLAATGRPAGALRLIEAYAKHNGLWFDPDLQPRYSQVIEVDLSAVDQSLAGLRRPQDRLSPTSAAHAVRKEAVDRNCDRDVVAIAAITSCTNTSDPRLLIAAGLLARNARALGLTPPAWVKTSLTPGSPAAQRYLQRAGLLAPLEELGFGIAAYGCATCIGNSGPLSEPMQALLAGGGVLPVAVLSGNRNFPGRIHPQIDASLLASPPLVVAYGLAGSASRDLSRDPIGVAADGSPVYLRQLWPTGEQIDAALARACDPKDYELAHAQASRHAAWQALSAPDGPLFPWDETSTYLRRPPFASRHATTPAADSATLAAPLLVLGDDVTTDHISPAGQVPRDSAAGAYLIARGENPHDLNVYAARRGNWEAMQLGLFTNPAVRNLLGTDIPPGYTRFRDGTLLPLWDAAERYGREGTPTVIVAGERYGAGSSRDWAAKGLWLLGVRAVLALSFERIHRSNLIGMGILPLQLPPELTPAALGLEPSDVLQIDIDPARLTTRAPVAVEIQRSGRLALRFTATAQIETAREIALLRAGGILPYIIERHRSP